MRCLLVDAGQKRILIDTGIGNKQSKSFFKYYTEPSDFTLETSLIGAGFSFDDITDVVLTHLHFDHCGGCVNLGPDKKPFAAFKNATLHIGRQQWNWALNPNFREAPSFLPENILPLQDLYKINFMEYEQELFPGLRIKLFNGHTDGQVIPYLRIKDKTLVYCADLFPSTAHVPLTYNMAYDTRPLLTIEDKTRFFDEIDIENTVLFFEHDLYTECCTLLKTNKGFVVDKKFTLMQFVESLS
jgi:glyoxylase-like metal-dependent hydrolase (beta-lactamase superfamily II)